MWPTTPAILRETTTTTELSGRILPAQTLIVVLAPFFHRDDERCPTPTVHPEHLAGRVGSSELVVGAVPRATLEAFGGA